MLPNFCKHANLQIRMKQSISNAYHHQENRNSSSKNIPLMASLSSLTLPSPNPNPNPNPKPNPRILHFPIRTYSTNFSVKSSSSPPPPKLNNDPPPNPPPSPAEKKSFAVVTGELFIGIAARLIKSRIGNGNDRNSVKMFGDDNDLEEERLSYFWRREKEGIAAVLEDPVQPEVVWEQRLKDVEAERGRKAVTSPGFSFSAAGLLFPYHLGVAQFLIENGYIKVKSFVELLCFG